MATPRPSTSYSTRNTSTSDPSYQNGYKTSTSQPARTSTAHTRPSTAAGRRSRAGSIIGGGEAQKIISAISEGRGITPTVGLAFVNISTGEAVLSQVCDNQFYVRTLNKLQVFEPTEILIVSTAAPPNAKSKMYQVVEENIVGARIITVDRRYWSEAAGIEYIQQLAFSEDVEAIQVAIGGNYFATCCFAAAVKYIDLSLSLTFAFHSLRIKYQPSEGTMMIDLPTIQSLELIQNIQNTKSKDCLFGLLNETLTRMGARLLRSFILQPSTQPNVLNQRYDAVEELSTKEDMFFQSRQALKSFEDIEQLLTCLIIIPTQPDIHRSEQSINKILMLKSFVQAIAPLFEALSGARAELLVLIRENCRPDIIRPTVQFISEVINDDVIYSKQPIDLRNQRTYAVKSGVSGLLDVARQTFKEATEDVHQHVTDINHKYEMQVDTRYDSSRRYYLRVSESNFDGRTIPDILINHFRKKGFLECQTLDLVKLNQRIEDSHQEVVLMSDKTIQDLLDNIRGEIPSLFRVCESIAMLDMLATFAQLVTTNKYGEYVRPELTEWLCIKSGRHPVREKNIDKNSIAIIDELGRGTSTRDGLAIALSIAEALVESKALVWFATHFRELAQIMAQRAGVINMHLTVDMSEHNAMAMLYKIDEGYVQEEHYGLALARVLDLPPQVLEVAEEVSQALDAQVTAKKNSSKALALARRRKLVLGLRETLQQAESSPMEGKVLLSWLRKLQEEFVNRMEQIENDVASNEADETVVDEHEGGLEMEEDSNAQSASLQD